MVLRIFKIIATSGHLTALKWVFSAGAPSRAPLGELTALPQSL